MREGGGEEGRGEGGRVGGWPYLYTQSSTAYDMKCHVNSTMINPTHKHTVGVKKKFPVLSVQRAANGF